MSNPRVEALGKSRRLFYDKVTGEVLGTCAGGGAIAALTGDDLIVATFNDETAPDRTGCLEEYYKPVGTASPKSVDSLFVAEYAAAVAVLREARASSGGLDVDVAFASLCDVRDAAIVFEASPVEPDLNEAV